MLDAAPFSVHIEQVTGQAVLFPMLLLLLRLVLIMSSLKRPFSNDHASMPPVTCRHLVLHGLRKCVLLSRLSIRMAIRFLLLHRVLVKRNRVFFAQLRPLVRSVVVQGSDALLRRFLLQRFLVEIFVLVWFVIHDTAITHYALVIHSKLVL